jgi:hypothetical protein
MKVKVYVVDFEVPARTKRLAIALGIPAAMLAGVVAVAYVGFAASVAVGAAGGGNFVRQGTYTSDSSGGHSHAISGGDSETRPPNAYVNYIIKY